MTGKLRGGRSIFDGGGAISTLLRRFGDGGEDVAYQAFRRAVEAGDDDGAARLAALFWNGRR